MKLDAIQIGDAALSCGLLPLFAMELAGSSRLSPALSECITFRTGQTVMFNLPLIVRLCRHEVHVSSLLRQPASDDAWPGDVQPLDLEGKSAVWRQGSRCCTGFWCTVRSIF